MTRTEHLLVCLSEECGEVQHTISKILRFGWIHEWPGTGKTNLDVLSDEVNDVLAVIRMLIKEGYDIPLDICKQGEKQKKVEKFILHAKSIGTITE